MTKEIYCLEDLFFSILSEDRFIKEKQNEPGGASDDAFFDLSRVVEFRLVDDDNALEILPEGSGRVLLSDLVIVGFLDSALGRSSQKNSGDYAAIATVGFDGKGHYYALDLWLRRAAPTAQIAALFDLHARWNYTLFGVETNCFQHLLLMPIEEERKRRRAAGQPWKLPLREVHHSQNKEMRIATLEPLLSNGWLRLSNTLGAAFRSQLESFPHGQHDDGVDALEAAVALLRGMAGETKRGAARKTVGKMRNY